MMDMRSYGSGRIDSDSPLPLVGLLCAEVRCVMYANRCALPCVCLQHAPESAYGHDPMMPGPTQGGDRDNPFTFHSVEVARAVPASQPGPYYGSGSMPQSGAVRAIPVSSPTPASPAHRLPGGVMMATATVLPAHAVAAAVPAVAVPARAYPASATAVGGQHKKPPTPRSPAHFASGPSSSMGAGGGSVPKSGDPWDTGMVDDV